MDTKSFLSLKELVQDAEDCPRLTQFEREVLDTVEHGLTFHGELAEFSDNQWRIIRQIEAKVYA